MSEDNYNETMHFCYIKVEIIKLCQEIDEISIHGKFIFIIFIFIFGYFKDLYFFFMLACICKI